MNSAKWLAMGDASERYVRGEGEGRSSLTLRVTSNIRANGESRVSRWVLAILVLWAGAAMAEPPQPVFNRPVIVESEFMPLPVAEQPAWNPEYVCEDVCADGERPNSLVRWWRNCVKPSLQFSHWGYPEYFEEMPFGTAVRSHKMVQVSKGWAARCVLYQYDFCEEDMNLNPSGERRLKELAGAFYHWSQHPLVIEATPQRPELAAVRRNHVAQLLHDRGVPARVEVGVPTGFMPTGEEALLMNQNLLEQVRSGGGTVGGAPAR